MYSNYSTDLGDIAETGSIRNAEGTDADSTGSDESEAGEVCHDMTAFAVRLGLCPDDGEEAAGDVSGAAMTEAQLRLLFESSAGHLGLARTVVRVLRETSLPQDIALARFADYVATLAPQLNIRLRPFDECAAQVLSHLSRFSRQTALQAISALAQVRAEGGMRDAESTLTSLRMAGVVTPVPGSGDDWGDDSQRRFEVPGLLAAKLRHDFVDHADHAQIIGRTVTALTEQLERARATDAALLADVLRLSHRAGQWTIVAQLQEAFGLPIFLLAPSTSCSVFSGLPAEALTAEPDLAFAAHLASMIVEGLDGRIDKAAVRSVLAELTGPGQLRQHFPAAASASSERGPRHESGRGHGHGHEHGSGEEGRDYFGVLSRIVSLAAEGKHVEAAGLGLDWNARTSGRRSQLVIRFLTAVSLFHSAQPQRALSILHELEAPARENHVDGDFLLPAVLAWSALVGVCGADTEAADAYLSRVGVEKRQPTICDELVTPALSIAKAKRALDRLDLEAARREYEVLSTYQDLRSLWVFHPAIGRAIGLLSATSEPGLLYTNDEVEKGYAVASSSIAGTHILSGSRGLVFIALGQLRWAEREIERMASNSEQRVVLSTRIELVSGRSDSAISMVDTWFYHQSLTPTSRAELAAIKAVALLRLGRTEDTITELTTAVGLCAWVRTLLPLALLPQQDRVELIDLSQGMSIWDDLVSAFERSADGGSVFERLRTVGSISVRHASLPQLSAPEAHLLNCIAEGMSVEQISREMHQVTGTVKNRLSALYRKFGVSNRSEVVVRARSLGFLSPG